MSKKPVTLPTPSRVNVASLQGIRKDSSTPSVEDFLQREGYLVETSSGKVTKDGDQVKAQQNRDPATMTDFEKKLAVRRFGIAKSNGRAYTYCEDSWNVMIQGTFRWLTESVEELGILQQRLKKDGTYYRAYFAYENGVMIKGTYEPLSLDDIDDNV